MNREELQDRLKAFLLIVQHSTGLDRVYWQVRVELVKKYVERTGAQVTISYTDKTSSP
ncbi:MAG TPA: hypothetical protein VIY48_01985 [Candidatus Paceibacterota bacterium]